MPDDLLVVPDAPATKKMPSSVAAELSGRRLYVAGASETPALRSLGAPGDKGEAVHELQLPGNAFLGRPGQSAARLERADVKVPKVAGTEPMRPDWVAQALQPRLASSAPPHAPIKRINGDSIEPYYGVYGADDRLVYYPNSYPWHCVGRIFTWSNWAGGGGWKWSGSGALVGARTILTAGHVCPWGSGSWAMPFVPAYWNGVSVKGAGTATYISDYRGWNTNESVAANDVAVLRALNPIGSSLGWMGAKTYNSSWQGEAYWTTCGYPGMVAGAERPSYQSSIRSSTTTRAVTSRRSSTTATSPVATPAVRSSAGGTTPHTRSARRAAVSRIGPRTTTSRPAARGWSTSPSGPRPTGPPDHLRGPRSARAPACLLPTRNARERQQP